MRPEEIRTIKEQLGVTSAQLGNYFGISQRSIDRWLSGEDTPTADRQQELLRLLNWRNTAAQTLVDTVRRLDKEQGRLNRVPLVRYAPKHQDWCELPTWLHASAIGLAYGHLLALGYPASVVEFDPDIYFKWLGGRKDGQQMRAQWAGEQCHA